MRGSSLLVAAALAAPTAAHADWERKPYLQDLRPDGALLMWKTRGTSAATITVEGPGGPRTYAVKSAVAPRARVDGLQPATRYRYTVKAGADVAGGELTTAPLPGAQVPVTFVVVGDNRSQAVAHYEVVERIRVEVPDFMISTGDMVMDGAVEAQWKQFFDIEGPLLADNVLYPALGNHDFDDNDTTWVETLFNPPADRQAPGQYAFTYGPVRVIILESNTPSYAMTDETAWLERQLVAYQQDPTLRHLFVAMHHPVYSISSHGGLTSLREKWAPLFEQYAASAVFSGHDHGYQRSMVNGVHYYVTGGGGAPLYGVGKRVSSIDASTVARFEKVHHFLRVHVIGDLVEVTAIREDGTPVETISWIGGKNAPKIEGVPPRELLAAAPTADVARPGPPASSPAPTAGTAAPAPAVRAAVGGGAKIPRPVALGGLAGLALLAAAGLWRLTRPSPARVRIRRVRGT